MRTKLATLVLVLGACTEADLAPEQVIGAEDPLTETSLRTRVYRTGNARLGLGAEPLPGEGTGYLRGEMPVVEVAEQVRVVHSDRDANLLLWLEPEDLGTWVIDGTRGSARPNHGRGDTGVWLDGAPEVEILDVSGGWTEIGLETADWSIHTWVPAFDVGPYWVERGRPPSWDGPHDVWLRALTEVRDAPDGRVLATVAGFGDPGSEERTAYLPATVLEEAGEHVRVESGSDGVTVVGWVRADELGHRVEGGRGFTGGCGGCFGGGGWGVWPNLFLPAGTVFYDGPDGEVVGETLQARGWPIGRTVDGWTSTRVHTPWGTAEVWVW